nr:immunoglobulin heavy chain junction region [Macaca mulatta]MOW85688.1 immunoglobulin heavy chain junction region [Macaca mulatta]
CVRVRGAAAGYFDYW